MTTMVARHCGIHRWRDIPIHTLLSTLTLWRNLSLLLYLKDNSTHLSNILSRHSLLAFCSFLLLKEMKDIICLLLKSYRDETYYLTCQFESVSHHQLFWMIILEKSLYLTSTVTFLTNGANLEFVVKRCKGRRICWWLTPDFCKFCLKTILEQEIASPSVKYSEW